MSFTTISLINLVVVAGSRCGQGFSVGPDSLSLLSVFSSERLGLLVEDGPLVDVVHESRETESAGFGERVDVNVEVGEVRTSHARGGSNGSSGAFWKVIGFGVAQLLAHTESDKEPWDRNEKTGPEDELEFGVESEEDVHSGVDSETSSDGHGRNLTIILTLERSCGVTTIGVVPVVEVSISSGFTSQNFGGAREEANRSGQTIHTVRQSKSDSKMG